MSTGVPHTWMNPFFYASSVNYALKVAPLACTSLFTRLFSSYVEAWKYFVALLLGVMSVFILGTNMLLYEVMAQESGDYVVDAVAFQGMKRIDPEAVKSQLKHTRGVLSRDNISEDLKIIFKTGFFDQVTVRYLSDGEGTGKRTLQYRVVEKPVVRKVYIKGNKKVSETSLSEVFKFGAQRFLDRTRLETMAKNGNNYYQGRGFYDAKVSFSVLPVDENQVDVTFNVVEGKKFKISRIIFRGLDKIDRDDLVAVIETKRYKWWNSWLFGTGRLNRELLENDRNLIRQYFLDHGYLDATVSAPLIERDEEDLNLVFDITEGAQYKVGSIKVAGDLVNKSASDTLEGTKIQTGDIFSATEIRNDLFIISDKFGDKGYAFANIAPDTSVDKDTSTVGLTYQIDQGKKVKVGKIIIRGNQKTYDNVIRRDMRLNEQELFSSSKVKRSDTVLRRTGFFEEISVAPEPSTNPDEVNLGVSVKEGSTGSFSAGVGYSSFDGVILNSRVSEQNLFGTGRRLDLNVDTSSFRNDIVLSFSDPRINDSWVSGSIDAVQATRNLFDFKRRQSGGGIGLGYPFEAIWGKAGEDISAGLQYELYSNEIFSVRPDRVADLVIQSEGTSISSAFIPSLTRNTIDNPLNPTKGSRQNLSFEWAGAGGDAKYILFEGRNTWFYPLIQTGFGDITFSWRFNIGYGDSLNDDPFPLFKRYFPGGINSNRGYRIRSLGPRDSRGNLFGGSKQLLNTTELIFPLVNAAGLKGVVFFDAGDAFDDKQSFEVAKLKKSYGMGLRWASPVGPIRIEFGFPLDEDRNGKKKMQTQFSFGAPW
jgi:outer membrane protein insertion porin family